MKLEDMGEKALLELAQKICEEDSRVKVGIGDDAAVLKFGDEGLLTITTDMLIEDIHFTSDVSPNCVGGKAVAVNLSDLAAMGAEPLGLVYSLGVPREKDVDFVSDLMKGMNSAAKKYDTSVVGGDLNEANHVIISGTAFGKNTEDRLLLRSGAKPGDFIGVTGELGKSAAAVKAMLTGIPLDDGDSLREAFLRPVARVEEGLILSKNGKVNSAIDITDGLASNLWQISRASEVGIIVDFEDIPISNEVYRFSEEYDIDIDELVLYGGEDFELLFTVSSEAWGELVKKFRKMDTKITKIGKVTSKKGVNLKRDEKIGKLPDKGYEHFKNS